MCERVCCLLKVIAEGTYNTKHAEAAIRYTILRYYQAILYYNTTILLHYYSCSYTEAVVGNWDEEAIQALRRATRAGVSVSDRGQKDRSLLN